MSACLFMYGKKALEEFKAMDSKARWEHIYSLVEFLKTPYDVNNRFDCDRWSGMHSNLTTLIMIECFSGPEEYVEKAAKEAGHSYRDRLAMMLREGMPCTGFVEELIKRIEELEAKNG